MVSIPVLLLFVLIQVADQRLTILNKTQEAINALTSLSNSLAELNRNANNDAAATINFDEMELEGREQEINDALKAKMAKERADDRITAAAAVIHQGKKNAVENGITKKVPEAKEKQDVVRMLKEDWKCAKLQACAMIGGKGKCKEKEMNEEECKNDKTGRCKREGKVCAKVDGTEVSAEVSEESGLHGPPLPHCEIPKILGESRRFLLSCSIESRKKICAKDGTKMCVEVDEMMSLYVEDFNGKKSMIESISKYAVANVGKEIFVTKDSRTNCTEKGCVVEKKMVSRSEMCPKGVESSPPCVKVDSKDTCLKECAKMGGTKEKCVQLCAILWNKCTNQQVAKWRAKVLGLIHPTGHKMQKCTKQCSADACLAVCDTDEECAKCRNYNEECTNECLMEPEKPCEKCKCTKHETKARVRVCNTNGTCHQASWETCLKWRPTVCKRFSSCFRDQDCGEIGFCAGTNVGKCNCNDGHLEDDPPACISGEKCIAKKEWYRTVPPCGGLEGACNKKSNLCDCEMGFRKAGFKGTADAMANFCAKKECYGDPEHRTTDDCFGFPCKSGLCICESKDNKKKGLMSANVIEEPKWKMAKVQPKNNDE